MKTPLNIPPHLCVDPPHGDLTPASHIDDVFFFLHELRFFQSNALRGDCSFYALRWGLNEGETKIISLEMGLNLFLWLGYMKSRCLK